MRARVERWVAVRSASRLAVSSSTRGASKAREWSRGQRARANVGRPRFSTSRQSSRPADDETRLGSRPGEPLEWLEAARLQAGSCKRRVHERVRGRRQSCERARESSPRSRRRAGPSFRCSRPQPAQVAGSTPRTHAAPARLPPRAPPPALRPAPALALLLASPPPRPAAARSRPRTLDDDCTDSHDDEPVDHLQVQGGAGRLVRDGRLPSLGRPAPQVGQKACARPPLLPRCVSPSIAHLDVPEQEKLILVPERTQEAGSASATAAGMTGSASGCSVRPPPLVLVHRPSH